MAALTDKLLASLKRHNPSKVRAYAGDDDHRDIAVPARRRKWGQVIEAIEAVAWTRVELLDKSGAVLGYVENTEPAAELQDLAVSSGAIPQAQQIVAMCLKAQRDAMHFRDAEVSALLKAQGDVVREMTAGMRALTAMYQEQVQAAERVAELRTVAAQGPEKGQVQELMEAMPLILQALPVLRSLISGTTPDATRPKNGA